MSHAHTQLLGCRSREAYKLTEIGTIPNDWEMTTLVRDIELRSGQHILAQDYNGVGDGTPYITGPSDFSDGSTSKISKWTTKPRVMSYGGEVLLTVKGSGAGRAFRLDVDAAAISRQLMALVPRRIDGAFLFHLIRRAERELSLKAVGNLIPGLSRPDLLSTLFALPPLIEQRAIAEALGDVDALIAAQQKLIAKKRAIKTATMQRLLTDKQRLPGFGEGCRYKQTDVALIPEEWSVTTLAQVSSFITKGATPTTYGFGWQTHGTLFLRSECVSEYGIDLSQSMYISETAHRVLNRSTIRRGDILMTITGNVGRVALFEADVNSANINQHIARIRIEDEDCLPSFVYYYLTQSSVRSQLSQIVT